MKAFSLRSGFIVVTFIRKVEEFHSIKKRRPVAGLW